MKIPCKTCISFAICKQRIKKLTSNSIISYSSMIDCKDLENYLKDGMGVYKARRYFELPSLWKDEY